MVVAADTRGRKELFKECSIGVKSSEATASRNQLSKARLEGRGIQILTLDIQEWKGKESCSWLNRNLNKIGPMRMIEECNLTRKGWTLRVRGQRNREYEQGRRKTMGKSYDHLKRSELCWQSGCQLFILMGKLWQNL